MVDRTLPLDDAEPPRGVAEVVDIGSDDDDDGGGGAWSESDEGYSGGAGSRGDLDADAVVPYGLRGALSPAPVFGNVAVANSTDVQFGNKTFFNGPVTIRQVVYAADAHGAADAAVQHAASCVGPAEPASDAVDVKVVGTTVVCCGGARLNGSAAGAPAARGGWWQRTWKEPSRRWRLLGVSALLSLLLGGGIFFSVTLYQQLTARRDPPTGHWEIAGPWITPETNVTLSGKLRIIPRRDWLAQPFRGSRQLIETPVPYVIVSHTKSMYCETQASCMFTVRNLQVNDIEGLGLHDISSNFLVGGDGYVYEGRGWGVEGALTHGWNNRSVGINMLGTFTTVLPAERQLLALKQLIELGVSEGHIAEDYKLLGQLQVIRTESPGAALYKELQTWPHWCRGTLNRTTNTLDCSATVAAGYRDKEEDSDVAVLSAS